MTVKILRYGFQRYYIHLGMDDDTKEEQYVEIDAVNPRGNHSIGSADISSHCRKLGNTQSLTSHQLEAAKPPARLEWFSRGAIRY